MSGGCKTSYRSSYFLDLFLRVFFFPDFFLADFVFATLFLAACLDFFFVDLFLATFFFTDFFEPDFFESDFFCALDFFLADLLADFLVDFLADFLVDFFAEPRVEVVWEVFFFADLPRKATSQPSAYFSVEPILKIDMVVFKPLQGITLLEGHKG